MPMGKGTYGSKRGRPPKAKMMGGGMMKKKGYGKSYAKGGDIPAAADKKAKGKGAMKPVPKGDKGLAKLPRAVRNKMGFMSKGGKVGKK
tara:strand:+ start:1040 stop:1306 length:267 start_codon:yes stop_codon:yes gene_type:complete